MAAVIMVKGHNLAETMVAVVFESSRTRRPCTNKNQVKSHKKLLASIGVKF